MSGRRFVHARFGDTLQDVAARELPGDDEAARQIASWNLHLAYRRSPMDDPSRLLPTDLVYVEPPQP